MLLRWTPLVVLTLGGCASFGPTASLTGAVAAGRAGTASAAQPVVEGTLAAPAAELTETQAMAEVAPMLGEIAAADPKLHAEVLEQLAGSKPSLWSLTVQRAKQTLDYKQQLAKAQPPAAPTAAKLSTPPSDSTVVQASATLDTAPIPTVVGSAGATPSVIQNQHVPDTASATQPAVAAPEAKAVLPEVPANSPGGLSAPTDWRARLDAAIEDLSAKHASPPRSTDEAREGVRLKLLQLAAGRTEQAVASPQGLSAAEQGYWSNQLYALATLLEEEKSADLRARADAAARHQAEATAKLSAMGALQIKNFVACREVYGYGAYEPLTDHSYAPSDQVVLYAEIEQFQSNVTKEGYRTTIASSYRLVDASGAEVASGDFPEVDDLCLTQRRDFHIQYGLTLPATLAAGDYRLELTVRDRLADKIGHDELSVTVGPR